MAQFEYEYHSHFTYEQLYNLVMDIENYPLFIPWCKNAKILKKEANIIYAELTIYFFPYTKCYISKITSVPPQNNKAAILTTLAPDNHPSNPFEYLENNWTFEQLSDGTTKVIFYIDFKLKSALLDKVLSEYLKFAYNKIREAFEARARDLYEDLDV